MNSGALGLSKGGISISSGSDARLGELYAAHGSNAVRLAALLTGDPAIAEDIAQEAFARLGGRLLTLRQPDRAAGYLYRTVANLARGHGRRISRNRKLGHKLSSVPYVHDSPPAKGPVWHALLQLPLRQRTALFLRYYLDMSEAEAAEVMGLSTAAMKSLTHRASQACRKELEGSADGGV